MKIFITGSKGNLGTMICDPLRKQGHEVVDYDLVDGDDILDFLNLQEKMEGADVVIHAAAIPHPNMGHISDYIEVNVLGTLNVLEAAFLNNVPRFIYISSTAYYQLNTRGMVGPDQTPIDEDTRFRVVGKLCSYDTSKRMAEELCNFYFSDTDMSGVILRFGPTNSIEERDKFLIKGVRDDTWRRRSFWGVSTPDICKDAIIEAVQKDMQGAYHIIDQTDLPVDGHPPSYWSNDKWRRAVDGYG